MTEGEGTRCGRPIGVRVCQERVDRKLACGIVRLAPGKTDITYAYHATGTYTDTLAK